jgi:CelD/BcsL family acetyltransferase involved in cellulose biosynthesis
MRRTTVIEGERALDGVRRAHRLLDVVGAPHTARSSWLDCAAAAFPDRRPVTVLVEDGDDVVAVACLARRDGAVVEWTALGHEVNDYAVLAAADDDATEQVAEAVAELLGRQRGRWRLRLEQLPAGDPVAARLLQRLSAARIVAGMAAARLQLTEPRTVNQHVSRNARRAINRTRNLLDRNGHAIQILTTRDAAAISGRLEQLVELHRARDHQVGRRSDLDDEQTAAFYRGVVTELSRQGQVELTTVTVGGELASYNLAILDRGHYRLWDGRISPKWSEYSMGRLCDLAALESALADGRFTEVDWMRGILDYKTQMMTHTADFEHLHAWSSEGLRRVDAARAAVRGGVRAATPERIRRWARLRRR